MPMLQPGIEHRIFCTRPHGGSTLNVRCLVRPAIVILWAYIGSSFHSTHSTEHFHRLGMSEVAHVAFVVSPVQGEPEQWVSKPVFVCWVEIHEVAAIGHVLT